MSVFPFSHFQASGERAGVRECESTWSSMVCYVAGEGGVGAVSRCGRRGALPAGSPSRGAVGTGVGRVATEGVGRGPAERGSFPGRAGRDASRGCRRGRSLPPAVRPAGPQRAAPSSLRLCSYFTNYEPPVQFNLKVVMDLKVRPPFLWAPGTAGRGSREGRLHGVPRRPGAPGKFGRV